MNSCPKCGTLKIEIKGKMGRCRNMSCLFKGPERTFRGLSGNSERDPYSPHHAPYEGIRSGIHKIPVRYDDDDNNDQP